MSMNGSTWKTGALHGASTFDRAFWGSFSACRRSRATRAFTPLSEVTSVEGLVFQRSSGTGASTLRRLRLDLVLLV